MTETVGLALRGTRIRRGSASLDQDRLQRRCDRREAADALARRQSTYRFGSCSVMVHQTSSTARRACRSSQGANAGAAPMYVLIRPRLGRDVLIFS